MRISLAPVIKPILIKGPGGTSVAAAIASGSGVFGGSTAVACGDLSGTAGFEGTSGTDGFADFPFWPADAEEEGGRGCLTLVVCRPQAGEKRMRRRVPKKKSFLVFRPLSLCGLVLHNDSKASRPSLFIEARCKKKQI